MNFYIPKDELITHKHINFSVDLDEDGLLICSTPPNLAIPKRPENTSPNLMSDLNHLSWEELYAIGLNGDARRYIALGAVKTDHMKNGLDVGRFQSGSQSEDLPFVKGCFCSWV